MANSDGAIYQAIPEAYSPIGVSVWGDGLDPQFAPVTLQQTGEVLSRTEFAERYPCGVVLSVQVIPSGQLNPNAGQAE